MGAVPREPCGRIRIACELESGSGKLGFVSHSKAVKANASCPQLPGSARPHRRSKSAVAAVQMLSTTSVSSRQAAPEQERRVPGRRVGSECGHVRLEDSIFLVLLREIHEPGECRWPEAGAQLPSWQRYTPRTPSKRVDTLTSTLGAG